MRYFCLSVIGTTGTILTAAMGGWDYTLQALFIFMAIDYFTGIITAGVFKKSRKSETGALSSSIGFMGLIRKAMMLIFVIIGYHLDNVVGWDFIRNGVIIALLANELISIIENAGLMGIPVPPVLKKAIDVLNKKEDVV